jgi:hypothetical protein
MDGGVQQFVQPTVAFFHCFSNRFLRKEAVHKMDKAIMRSALLLTLTACAAAQSGQRICAWYSSRYGVVRDALYIDGGAIYQAGWSDGNWSGIGGQLSFPSGKLHAFNFSSEFEGLEPVDLGDLLDELPLTAGGNYDAPDMYEGAMLTSNFELYTYG